MKYPSGHPDQAGWDFLACEHEPSPGIPRAPGSQEVCCPDCAYRLAGHIERPNDGTITCPECGQGVEVEQAWQLALQRQCAAHELRLNIRALVLLGAPGILAAIFALLAARLSGSGNGADGFMLVLLLLFWPYFQYVGWRCLPGTPHPWRWLLAPGMGFLLLVFNVTVAMTLYALLDAVWNAGRHLIGLP
ncbi:MAG: hypothetical protein ACYTGG_08650 [Planctomycetota bacterium]